MQAENKVREAWAPLTPQLDETEKEILLEYLTLRISTPYRVASNLGMPVSKTYRKVRRLAEKRLLIPLRYPSKETLHISVKGCLALYALGMISFDDLYACFKDLWDVDMTKDELLGFLYLLSVEVRRRELNLKTITMCKIDEASVHVLRFLKKAILIYINEGISFSEALDAVAKEVNFDRMLTREGMRLSLKGISKTLPIILHTEDHKIAFLFHDRFVFPFVIECKAMCPHFKESLGFECPLAQEARAKIPLSVRIRT